MKPIPHQLEELRLVNCGKLSPVVTCRLLDFLNEKSYIRKLSLVNAGISDDICLKKLSLLMHHSRVLTELDISWNRIRPNVLLDFMHALSENRNLQYLNLSWNNLIERAEITDPARSMSNAAEQLSISEEDISKMLQKSEEKYQKASNKLEFMDIQYLIMLKLTRFIKYNRNLLHLDLSHTGLN